MIKRARSKEPSNLRLVFAFFFHVLDCVHFGWRGLPAVCSTQVTYHQDLRLPECGFFSRKCQIRIFEPLKHLLAIFHMIRNELSTTFLIFRFIFLLIRTSFYRNIIQEWHRDVRNAILQDFIHGIHHMSHRVRCALG